MAEYYVGKLEKAFGSSNVNDAVNTLSDMVSLINSLPSQKEIEKYNFDLAIKRHKDQKTAVLIGDSHVNVFSGNENLTLLSIGHGVNICPDNGNKPFTALHLGPCLAYNSQKYNTTNKFIEKYEWLTSCFLDHDDIIIISLGEIDMRAHVYKEVQKQGCTYEKVLDDILKNYTGFLLAQKQRYPNLYVWAPIASQKDYHPNDHKLLPRYGTECERNLATKLFSEKLSAFCSKNKIGFLSILDKLIDKNLQTIEDYYSNDFWHLSQKAYPVIEERWNQLSNATRSSV